MMHVATTADLDAIVSGYQARFAPSDNTAFMLYFKKVFALAAPMPKPRCWPNKAACKPFYTFTGRLKCHIQLCLNHCRHFQTFVHRFFGGAWGVAIADAV